jgi:hypothetical protein
MYRFRKVSIAQHQHSAAQEMAKDEGSHILIYQTFMCIIHHHHHWDYTGKMTNFLLIG